MSLAAQARAVPGAAAAVRAQVASSESGSLGSLGEAWTRPEPWQLTYPSLGANILVRGFLSRIVLCAFLHQQLSSWSQLIYLSNSRNMQVSVTRLAFKGLI